MEQQNVTQVHHITGEELTAKILIGVEQKLNEFEKNFQPKEQLQWMTRKEVANFLSITLMTVVRWSKKGILNPFKIGNQIRYKRIEVENALTKINS